MMTINAAGDLFQPYLLLPLAYLPRNIAPFVIKEQMIVSGTSHGYMTDETFSKWLE